MSYDLMVFDLEEAPKNKKEFMEWYRIQIGWGEGHGYEDPEVSSPALQNWFHDIIREFPPMNGPLASEACDDNKVTDYSIGHSIVYAGFSWSCMERAYQRVKELAQRHGVGFFDVSSQSGDIWWMNSDGKLELLRPCAEKAWWRFWK